MQAVYSLNLASTLDDVRFSEGTADPVDCRNAINKLIKAAKDRGLDDNPLGMELDGRLSGKDSTGDTSPPPFHFCPSYITPLHVEIGRTSEDSDHSGGAMAHHLPLL